MMVKKRRNWLVVIVVVLFAVVLLAVASEGIVTLRPIVQEAVNARATGEVSERERYPWGFYPISEQSKAALCQVLALSPQDKLCQLGTSVYHRDVASAVEEAFPPGRTTYTEVEVKLGSFPHERQESRLPDGTLTSLVYAYQLTEYEGACVYFVLDINTQVIKRIGRTTLPGPFDGPIPTRCIRGRR